MASYAEGRKAFGFCDRCGFRYNLKDLKTETVNLATTNLLVCPECWDPDHPQNMLGRVRVDDPQALRNPRPLGGISGRDLPAAHRWTFESATLLDTPTRVNGWNVNPSADNPVGTVPSWNSDEQVMNWHPEPGGSGLSGSWIQLGYNAGQNSISYPGNDLLGIDASVYKYVTLVMRVNNFPVKDSGPSFRGTGNPYHWRGRFFWSNDTTVTNGVSLSHVSIDSSQNATFTYTGDANISVGNRYAFSGLNGEYISGNSDTELSDLNNFESKGNIDSSSGRNRFMVTAVDTVSRTFTVEDSMIVGDGVTRSLSGTPHANCPYPWSEALISYSLPVKNDVSKFLNSQPSSGFPSNQKPLSSIFKVTWDLSENDFWTGTVNAIRIDTFDTYAAEPDFNVDFISVAVEAYHNPDL